MHAVPLAAGQLTDLLLLVRAFEIEPADIGARLHFAIAELEHIVAAGDLLEHRLLTIQRVARLINIAELDCLADADRTVVGLVLAHDHAEQCGLAGPIRPDHADNAPGGQLKGKIIDQEPLSETLLEVLGVDDDIAEPRSWRDGDLRLSGPVLAGLC